MQPRLSFITLAALCLVQICSSQTTVSERIQPPWSAVYKALVLDTTLLFNAPDVAWNCSYTDGATGLSWLRADIVRLKECRCTADTYRKVPNGKENYTYKLISSVPRGSLVRTSDSTFTYTEFASGDSTAVHRVLSMAYNVSKVVKADSVLTENINTGNLDLIISKAIELRVATTSDKQIEGKILCKTMYFPNTVIRGVDNWVSVTVPGVPSKKMHIRVSQGEIEYDDGTWNIRPDVRGIDSLKLDVQWKQNGRPHNATHWLKVRNVPTQPYFGGKSVEDSLISMRNAALARGVRVRVINIGFDLSLPVTHYRMTVTDQEGEIFDGVSEEAEITEAMEQALNNLHEGDKLDITEIHVLLPGDVDHVVQSFHFTVIP